MSEGGRCLFSQKCVALEISESNDSVSSLTIPYCSRRQGLHQLPLLRRTDKCVLIRTVTFGMLEFDENRLAPGQEL